MRTKENDLLTIKQLQKLIIVWGQVRNIEDPKKQFLKFLEEVGETARAVLKQNKHEIKDGIGDIAVTLILLYHLEEKTLTLNTNSAGDLGFGTLAYRAVLRSETVLSPLEAIAQEHGTTLVECLNIAWNVIKDREGEIINGTFVKNE